jgi:hypothetical protein
MAKESSIDIFWLLGQLDRKNFNVWDELTEQQRKDVQPYVILRWLAGCTEPEQQVKLGEIAAACVFDLGKHPDLMLRVLTACTTGGTKRYRWQNPKGQQKVSSKAISLISQVYNCNERHAREYLPLFSVDELLALGEHQGLQPDELKELKKSL